LDLFSGHPEVVKKSIIRVENFSVVVINANVLRDGVDQAVQLQFRDLRSSMSVLVKYQRVTSPCSLRTGFPRIKNQRYAPSLLRKRASASQGSPLAIAESRVRL
jgi:hypothetical protein